MATMRQLSAGLRRLWSGSIRSRLIVGISSLLAVVMSAFVADMVNRQVDYLHRETEEETRALARTLAANSVSWVLASDIAGLQEVVQTIQRYPDVRYAMILARDGKVLAHTDPHLIGRYARDPVSDSLLRAPPSPQLLVNTSSLVDVAAPIRVGGAQLGWARVSLSQDRVSTDLRAIARNGIAYAAIGIALGTLLAVVLTRGLTRDLKRLVEMTRRISAGERGVQSRLRREDELGALAGAFDSMVLDLDRSDRELRESEEKFRQVSASAQDAIIVLDHDGRITDWNAAAEKIFGYAAAEIVGRDMHALIVPARHQSAFREGLKQFRLNGTGTMINRTLEMAALRRDGAEFPVELSISAAKLRGEWHAIGIVRDIGERKRREREALEQFKLAETFFKHSVSCLVILDRNFNFVRVNEAYARACRREIGEFAGRNHFEMYPSDAQEIFEEVVRTKRPFTTFTRAFVFLDQPERGTTYWDWTLVPILDAQNEVELLVFSLQEVTERKRAEEEQRAAALYARSLIEASMDPLVTISAQGKITDVNQSTEDVTGLARDRLVGTDFADYFTEPEKARAGYREVLARGYVRDYPLTIRHSSGRTTDVLYNATVYRNEAGELQGVFAAARDITERKHAEAVRTQLAAIVQSSHDAIIGKDVEGVITSWNPGAEKVYGYRADEVVGKPVSMLAPEGRKDEITGLLEHIRQGEAVMNFETERFRKDGKRIDVSLDLSPIRDASGRIVGASTIARDISEKKQAERALRKVNRALKALSDCNMALIHSTDENQLLNRICRVIVDIEGYRLAWVGYAEHDAHKTVRPVAQSGFEPGYMEHADITWADGEFGRGPLGIAIRSGQMQVVQDVKTDSRFEPWRASAAELGFGSVLVAPLVFDSNAIGALSIYAEGANAFDAAEIDLLAELAADMAFGIVTLRTRNAHEQSALRLQHSMEATIQVVAGTVEKRDPYTAGHQRRVAELATAIARDMGLADDRVHGIHLASVVHDLGKIQIPAEILSKPGGLTPIEFALIKSHPQAGYEILKDVDFPWPIAQTVLQHHERLDGSGYPRGLKGDEILLDARILMVADVVEAMASHRPYRPARGIDLALEEIAANAGKFYDADAAHACTALFRDKAFAFKT